MATKPAQGEFETFVQSLTARHEIRRFGAELMTPADDAEAAESLPLVPADYLIKPGDEILLTIWGSVDADLRLLVDRSGRVSIPRVGPVLVAGIRYADLPATISRRMALVFRNFELSVALGQLRGLRVYVTGFVAKRNIGVVYCRRGNSGAELQGLATKAAVAVIERKKRTLYERCRFLVEISACAGGLLRVNQKWFRHSHAVAVAAGYE